MAVKAIVDDGDLYIGGLLELHPTSRSEQKTKQRGKLRQDQLDSVIATFTVLTLRVGYYLKCSGNHRQNEFVPIDRLDFQTLKMCSSLDDLILDFDSSTTCLQTSYFVR